MCVCVCVCVCISSAAAYQQLPTQKPKPNHDETDLKDYSDLKGSFFFLVNKGCFLCGFTNMFVSLASKF